ncbi:MAG: hypothetical protein KL787_07980 [Taibaiella sp.]|nr:hypothetical protein [Taibaiella sp.]
MKILVLYNRVPFPLNDGGNIAVMALLKGLKEEGNQVHPPYHEYDQALCR